MNEFNSRKNNMRWLKKVNSIYWIIPIFIVALTYLIDCRYYSSPPIHSDDWSILSDQIFYGFQIFNIYDRRPLIDVPYFILASSFKTNLFYHYFVNFIILFLTCCVFYLVIKKSFPKHTWLALPIALVFIIYPLDFTKTWLVHIHAHLVLLLDLLVIFLLLEYKQNSKSWKLILANVLFIISLLIYEAGLGIVLMVAFLLLFDTGTSRVNKLRIITITLFTGIFYIVWRAYLQPSIFNLQDAYLDQLNTNVITIARRYIIGLIYVPYSWVRPIAQFLGPSKFIVLGATGFMLIALTIGFLPRIIKSAKASESFYWADRVIVLKSLLMVFLIGFLTWAAGYFPAIVLKGPSLDGNSTRNNLFASAGASIMLVSLISSLVALKVKTYKEISRKTILLIIPFVILGMFFQLWSQNQRFISWEDQKFIWNKTIEIAPDLQDDTNVGIIIAGYDDLEYFQILPFTWRWDARNAIRLLYNNQTLEAFYYYLDRDVGFLNQIPDEIEWSKTLLIYVDPHNNSSHILSQPEKILLLDDTTTGYNPELLISNFDTDSGIYRFLVR